jgi:large subunit ribosomal protein L32
MPAVKDPGARGWTHAIGTLHDSMAVPKQKQARSRTRKRRAQHKISAPRYNECPQCHSPRLPHRVCPECGHYAGREVVAPDAHDHDHDHD